MRCRITAFVVAVCAAVTLTQQGLRACTAFCATDKNGGVLVGNNEDYNNPRTRIRFVPGAVGLFGRLYVGFDDLYPQGGMNERGLWFDGFSAPAVKPLLDLPSFQGDIVDEAMAKCATVEDVVRLFSRYNRAFLWEGILMFADASGDAVSIEANAIVRKTGRHFVQTNFHQSRQGSKPDARFATATSMLERAGGDISVDLFRRILDATHQENGGATTLYSNVYDLRARKMYLYYFHDYDRVVTIDLIRELEKGARIVDIPSLFPPSEKAESFAAQRPNTARMSPAVIIAAVGGFLAVIAIAVVGWLRAARRVRIGALAAGGVAIAVVVTSVALMMHSSRPNDGRWLRFSIGPASGESTWISTNLIRANGVTVIGAIAAAYEIPSVRIDGPRWLSDTRFAIEAVVDVDSESSFRSYLKDELNDRLRLVTHVEQRPHDVLVLSGGDAARLEPAPEYPSIQVSHSGMRASGATLAQMASALQGVVRRPVIDETGIGGAYNMQFDWGTDRIATVTGALRDRFGLTLTPARRSLETLVVDDISPEPWLLVLAHTGRALRWAPPAVRERVSKALAVN